MNESEMMNKYDIRDVWMAIKLASKNFFILFILICLCVILYLPFPEAIFFYLVLLILALAQSIVIYFANRNYVIDPHRGTFRFPRSDIENSLLAIILCFPYWNLMRTMTIECSNIENIYLDTKRWTSKSLFYEGKNNNHALYKINVTGTFGSASLGFISKQKRDEVRNAIQQCVRMSTKNNIDKKIAEFDEFND